MLRRGPSGTWGDDDAAPASPSGLYQCRSATERRCIRRSTATMSACARSATTLSEPMLGNRRRVFR